MRGAVAPERGFRMRVNGMASPLQDRAAGLIEWEQPRRVDRGGVSILDEPEARHLQVLAPGATGRWNCLGDKALASLPRAKARIGGPGLLLYARSSYLDWCGRFTPLREVEVVTLRWSLGFDVADL